MPRQIVPQQPDPDGESIAEVVRERLNTLLHHDPPTLEELDEIARLHKLLSARAVYIHQRGAA